MDDVTKMIVPCQCPHCGETIVVLLDVPHPTAEIMRPEEVTAEIKNIIEDHDTTQEPEAA